MLKERNLRNKLTEALTVVVVVVVIFLKTSRPSPMVKPSQGRADLTEEQAIEKYTTH